MIKLIKKKLIQFAPEVIILIVFLFLYVPYLLLVNITRIEYDSHVYLLIARDFVEGNLPLSDNYVFDFFPYGLSYVFSIVYRLGGNIDTVVVLQILMSFLATSFLVHQVKKINYKVALALSIVLGFYCCLSESLTWNVTLYTESFFLSIVMIITGILFSFFSGITVRKLLAFSIVLLFALYLRSNAIVFLIIPFTIIIISWTRNRRIVWTQISLLFMVFLIISSTNYVVKGFFFPVEIKRFEYVFNSVSSNLDKDIVSVEKKDTEISEVQKGNRTYFDQAFDIYTNLANAQMGDFYYYRLPKSLRNLGHDSMTVFLNENKILKTYTKVVPNHEEYIDFVFRNYSIEDHQTKKVKDLLDIEKRPRDFWLYSVHSLHLLRYILKNPLVCLGFYLIFFLSIFKNFRLGFLSLGRKDFWLLIFILSSMYLIGLTPIVFAGGPNDPAFIGSLSRYSIVFEPLALLAIVLGIFQVIQDFKGRG